MSQQSKGKARFQAPRGTNDVLPEDEPYWRFVRRTGERVSARFGYRYIETPMFEDAGVWLRTSGEGTEVVEKEIGGVTYLYDEGGEFAGVPHLLMTHDQEPVGVFDVESGKVIFQEFEFE